MSTLHLAIICVTIIVCTFFIAMAWCDTHDKEDKNDKSRM